MSDDTLSHRPGGGYVASANAAAATLSLLRQQTLPTFIEPPVFLPRGREAGQPAWLNSVWRFLAARALLLAGAAAVALIAASAVSILSASGSTSAPTVRLGSSAGATAGTQMRSPALSASSLLGQVPFTRQQQYLNALAGSSAAGQRFVEGAREASIATYIQNVGVQLTLPYTSNAAAARDAIAAWGDAVAAAEARQAEAQRAAAVESAALQPITAWRSPAISGGAVIPAATLTFYSCLGNGFCGAMANGQQAFQGAAACSYDLPLGTRFVIANDPAQRQYVCLDRGALATSWVDIWFYDASDGWAWQAQVGTVSDLIILP
jgi:hypothetical protein